MNSGAPAELRRVLIRADRSAEWRIAGLSQLQRLLHCLDEYASVQGDPRIEVLIDPPVQTPPSFRHLRFVQAANAANVDLVLSTHWLLQRDALECFEAIARGENKLCRWVENENEIAAAETWLLHSSGKPQDGFVSRHFNRLLSRAVTRLLVRLPVTPTVWSLAIFVLPLIGAALIACGNYRLIVAGMLLFQLYSMLDGCDGEIARLKFAESERGRLIDTWCDAAAMILLILSVGIASRQYMEAAITALAIIANELGLALRPSLNRQRDFDAAIYGRHREMIERSGLLKGGRRFTSFLVQITKRDLAIFFFVLLALVGCANWILHFVLVVTCVTLTMQLNALVVRRGGAAAD